jgi:hypothetical protein
MTKADLCPDCGTFVGEKADGSLKPHHYYQNGHQGRWCVAPSKTKGEPQ